MLNPDLDINLLRAFTAVAERGSFTRAALELSRTQSAVSMQVRRLEQNLGRQLLLRSSRGLRLTETGELVLAYAKRILRLNDQALSEIGQPEVRGLVRLGIPDDYAAYLLPKVLAHFGSLYPQIRLEISCALSVDLLRQVRNQDIDLAVATRQPQSPGGTFLRREQLVWAESLHSRAHAQDSLPLALFPEGVCTFREAALDALERTGKAWQIVCTSRGLAGIRSAVSSGLAVTVVTENAISPDMRVIGIQEGLPPLPSADITLHLAESQPGEAVRVFAEHISKSLAQNRRDEQT
jgi:DNA-binding transcriptional LysR family regulator